MAIHNQGEFRLSGTTPVNRLPSLGPGLRGMFFHLRQDDGVYRPGYYHVSENGSRWVRFSENASVTVKSLLQIPANTSITIDITTPDTQVVTSQGSISLGPDSSYFNSSTNCIVQYNGVEITKDKVTYLDYNKISLNFALDINDSITVKS